ncbi:DNA-binding response regulator [Chitinophaga eiseniae]|uniref:Response regulator transcription factor n=1 Tax=Chitinophaga eiseniae TaxID=634771 RepID=A0A847SNZ3_9BACT|nr:response regulator transcription factor [Chitinophaga eiseniae]NLR77732.1 response regulator transcription factor [Chitinophaga eiseniae]
MQTAPGDILLCIVDEHKIIRNALASLFSKHHHIRELIEVETEHELMEQLYKGKQMNVILFHWSKPDKEKKACLRTIHQQYPFIRVLTMSQHFTPEVINSLLDLGVCGFFTKNTDSTELLEAISQVAVRGLYHNKLVADALYWRAAQIAHHGPETGKTPPLTPNQEKVLHLLWQEKSTQEIAAEIFVSISAVEKIKQQLKEMTGAKNTIGLIKYALKNSII